MVGSLTGLAAPQIPQGGPDAVRAWWDALGDADRQRYLIAHPDIIGALDGLPAEVRDRANRIHLGATECNLRSELASLKEQLANVNGGTRGSGVRFIQRIGEVETTLSALAALRGQLDRIPSRPGTAPAYLLGFSAKGQGRAIVAIGDPDRSRHTAVFVPGKGVSLHDAGRETDRVRDLWSAARDDAGPGGAAVITWVGYDAPQTLADAALVRSADEAAPKLGRFVDGLRAAHDPATPDHVTAIGHSYGSVVVATAAAHTPGGLAADDIVAVGSPGLRTGNAADLGVDREHVWVGRAKDDPVPAIGSVTYGLPIVGAPTPTDPDYGANTFTTEGASGHSSYWNPKHPDSLENQAAVIGGRYDRVRLHHGTAPAPLHE
ncbi:alpha/beta hydrolase [Yinghuangia soli]